MKKRTLKRDKKKKGSESKADPKRKKPFLFEKYELLMKDSLPWGKREISLFPLPAVNFTTSSRCFDKTMGLAIRIRGKTFPVSKLVQQRLHLFFQVICKDLWVLHLTLLPNPPPAELYLRGQESDEGTGDVKQPQESLVGEEAQVNDDDLENELELDALMQENSDISDSSEEEGNNSIPTSDKKPRNSKGRYAYESPASTVAVLVVGCWTLRIPVMYRDFSRYDG